jgi:hypothetical protein
MTTLENIQSTVSIDNGIRQETWEEAARRWKRQYDESQDNLREAERDIKDLTIRALSAERACNAVEDAAVMLCTQFIKGIRDGVKTKNSATS